MCVAWRDAEVGCTVMLKQWVQTIVHLTDRIVFARLG